MTDKAIDLFNIDDDDDDDDDLDFGFARGFVETEADAYGADERFAENREQEQPPPPPPRGVRRFGIRSLDGSRVAPRARRRGGAR